MAQGKGKAPAPKLPPHTCYARSGSGVATTVATAQGGAVQVLVVHNGTPPHKGGQVVRLGWRTSAGVVGYTGNNAAKAWAAFTKGNQAPKAGATAARGLRTVHTGQ